MIKTTFNFDEEEDIFFEEERNCQFLDLFSSQSCSYIDTNFSLEQVQINKQHIVQQQLSQQHQNLQKFTPSLQNIENVQQSCTEEDSEIMNFTNLIEIYESETKQSEISNSINKNKQTPKQQQQIKQCSNNNNSKQNSPRQRNQKQKGAVAEAFRSLDQNSKNTFQYIQKNIIKIVFIMIKKHIKKVIKSEKCQQLLKVYDVQEKNVLQKFKGIPRIVSKVQFQSFFQDAQAFQQGFLKNVTQQQSQNINKIIRILSLKFFTEEYNQYMNCNQTVFNQERQKVYLNFKRHFIQVLRNNQEEFKFGILNYL